MARYPEATWRPVTRYQPGGANCVAMVAYRRFQAHTAVSNGSLFNWFNTPGHAVSHFWVSAEGHVEQYIDTKFRSSATLQGNPDSITVETEDMGAPFPVWTGSNVPAWTDKQLAALVKLGLWAHKTHGIRVVLCPSSRSGTKGFSYHRQGIDPWRVTLGQHWSLSKGKVCPGDRRVAQWKGIVIPRVAALANPVMPSPVGVWSVQAKGAPFEPHLFTFGADGNLFTTNPTNVQESAIPGHPGGVNDSLGMGRYRKAKVPGNVYVGTFYQLNADAETHQPAERLRVTFRIEQTDSTHFTGKAVVHFGTERVPDATLIGSRLGIVLGDLSL